MLILHSRPASITFSLSGTGASFLTDADALTNGRPASTSRIQWLSAGSPATTDYLEVRASWPTATAIRGACLRNLLRGISDGGSPEDFTISDFPTGVPITWHGKRSGDAGYTYALGGNATTSETHECMDGSTGATALFDEGNDSLIGLAARIYNDASGSTFLTAADFIEPGEFFLGQGSEWGIRTQVGSTIDDPSILNLSLGNQPHVVERAAARLYDVEIVPTSFADAITAAQSLRWMRERLRGYRDCMVIPALRGPYAGGPSAAIDYSIVQAVAMFGKCTRLGDLRSLSEAPLYTLPLSFREAPAG